MAKKARKETPNVNYLDKPVDITKFGSSDDPCFGNYDASDETCRICGDCELCSIVTAQKLSVKRLKEESKGPFKDLKETENENIGKDKILKYLVKQLKDNVSPGKARRRALREFGLTEEQSKMFLRKAKNRI